MNLLKVQDALKNASDQQLMALMQAPDSTAPSYLVLSEIRRRKDMRSKQAAEGESRRTVAEDLTAPQEPVGIQGLQGQGSMDPDGVDVADGGVQGMAAGGLASLRRYREGGVIRMSDGVPGGGAVVGQRDPANPDLTAFQRDVLGIGRAAGTFIDEAERGRRIERLINRYSYGAPPFSYFTMRQGERERRAAEGREIADYLRANRGRFLSGEQDIAAFEADPIGFVRGQATTATPPATTPAAPPAATTPEVAPAVQGNQPAPPVSRPIIPPQSSIRTDVDYEPARTTPTAQGAPGIEGLRNAPPALPEGGQLPTMAELMQQNAALFPDGMGSIRERMREERVDPAARRNEAVNMALIEAGLRIAGSRNPSLIGAIGEGALPAVQSYGQQLGQIRGEQREARRDELELAKQETNRQFAIGQISAAEYRSRMENINRTLQVNAMERGANARLVASENAADRRAAAAAESERNRLRIEENRDTRARDLADLQERRRMRERAAIAANEAFANPLAREAVRQSLVAEARRVNPSERNPTISDQAVQERILRDTIARIEQAYQITPPGSRGGGSGNDPFSVR